METSTPSAGCVDISGTDEERPFETSPPPTRRQQVFGVALVVGVSFIWVASAELIQRIFTTSKYNKPYMLTYVSLSLLSTFLVGFLQPSWRESLKRPFRYKGVKNVGSLDDYEPQISTFAHTAKLAAVLTPFFFLCMWTFNLGLEYTSVASSSIIATLTSLFTLVFGAVTGVEHFSYPKLAATLMSIAGVSTIVIVDNKLSSPHGRSNLPVIGDLISVVSAALYATYTIILKRRAGPEGETNIAMMFGILGGIITLAAWPGIFIVHWVSIEKFEWPPKDALMFLFLNGMIGTVLSEFMWAMSIVLTTPMTTTLSLSLTVPLSIFSDVLLKGKKFGVSYGIGAILVIVGFIIANIDVASSRKKHEETVNNVATEDAS